MPKWITQAVSYFTRKENPAYPIYSQLFSLGTPTYTPRDYRTVAKESYEKNITCYRAVSLIAQSCAGIPWRLYRQQDKLREVKNHPLLDLLLRPNNEQSFSSLLEELISFWLLAGNAYLTCVRPSTRAQPQELWVLRPDRMRVIPGLKAIAGYEYSVDTAKTRFDPRDILHLKMFAATNDWYGLSPVVVAMDLIDQQNEGNDWNIALLQNAGRPSGALIAAGSLGPDQYDRLRKMVRERYIGKRNAGLPLLLEGGLDWKPFSLSPMELDWLESRRQNMRDISIALGVPPELLGDSANKTYCLPYESMVMTVHGPVPIGAISAGTQVYSLDDQQQMVVQSVVWVSHVGRKPIYRIAVGHTFLRATGTHPFYVWKDGAYSYINAQDLRVGDTVVTAAIYPHVMDACTACSFPDQLGVPQYCTLSTIVSIELLPSEEVYDLEVADTHTFFANHFCVHNSNYGEARQSFYQETILPLMDKLRDRLNMWFVNAYEGDLYLDYDKEEIEALQEDRDRLSNRVSSQWLNGILTLNEVRKAVGLDELPGGDILQLKATGVYYIPTAHLEEVVQQKIENLLTPPTALPGASGTPSMEPDTPNPSHDTEKIGDATGQERQLTEAAMSIADYQTKYTILRTYFDQERNALFQALKAAAFPETILPRLRKTLLHPSSAWITLYQTLHTIDEAPPDVVFWEEGVASFAKEHAEKAFTEYATSLSEEFTDAYWYAMTRGETPSEIFTRLEQVYTEWAKNQIPRIISEIGIASHQFKTYVIKTNEGIPYRKRWKANDPEHTSLDGQECDLTEGFLDHKGDALRFPGDGGIPCLCELEYVPVTSPEQTLTQINALLSGLIRPPKRKTIVIEESTEEPEVISPDEQTPAVIQEDPPVVEEPSPDGPAEEVEAYPNVPLDEVKQEVVSDPIPVAPTEAKAYTQSYRSFKAQF